MQSLPFISLSLSNIWAALQCTSTGRPHLISSSKQLHLGGIITELIWGTDSLRNSPRSRSQLTLGPRTPDSPIPPLLYRKWHKMQISWLSATLHNYEVSSVFSLPSRSIPSLFSVLLLHPLPPLRKESNCFFAKPRHWLKEMGVMIHPRACTIGLFRYQGRCCPVMNDKHRGPRLGPGQGLVREIEVCSWQDPYIQKDKDIFALVKDRFRPTDKWHHVLRVI